ncbi:energy-coupling factor transporter ATPase [Mammaliicoccus vitulinus]|uniref:Energy-coupling factor transporter ATP-binding protein EcfA2 n=2 Tax=Mammaliicoccus vitulinus TaxID=71237 RepID=A0A2T4PTZ3_9STAP|nr:energy-coupling factor transporter ATPase [Mammaliicoccus vitulinus]MBM6629072.1 energy-coupling factor transporter ATPase [Mammaliicoccus vitulinus]MBO3076150.1 energy-coupling factor transporter ATPase [Mammaliicoccus vitulinus]MEB7657169.1 energy-coupling factor transporter ATPase [Mammaliicoccus vitulinus]PNZ40998.1 energy-coupling factor transporter ATPase [Mammaliicoccus vitulinus]PTI29848.1 energy-coupling factor transporter ATPase [Mammaliicoccus vitulinus]
MKIIFDHVTYDYSIKTPYQYRALNEISTTFNESKFYAIVGQTGSGKSTLIQHLNAILKPTEGQITIDDTVITKKTKSKKLAPVRKKVGIVFQFAEHQLFEDTVEKDIIFGPLNYGMEKAAAIHKAEELIDLLGMERSILKRSPFELSGGQKRRIAIAGVLAMEPEILVLDEPTVGLDPRGQHDMMELFNEIHQTLGITIILISHQMDIVLKYADEVKVIKAGEIVAEDQPVNIFTNQELLNQTHLQAPKIIQLQRAVETKYNMKFDQVATCEEMFKDMYEKQVKRHD